MSETTPEPINDELFQHATCNNIHPLGTIPIGDPFNTLCGKFVIKDGPDTIKERCPECLDLHHQYIVALMTGDDSVVCKCGEKALYHE